MINTSLCIVIIQDLGGGDQFIIHKDAGLEPDE